MILILSILGTVFSLAGNILIAIKKRLGWIMWLIGNVLWISINFLNVMNVPMVVMYLVYMILNIIGFISWGRDGENKK